MAAAVEVVAPSKPFARAMLSSRSLTAESCPSHPSSTGGGGGASDVGGLYGGGDRSVVLMLEAEVTFDFLRACSSSDSSRTASTCACSCVTRDSCIAVRSSISSADSLLAIPRAIESDRSNAHSSRSCSCDALIPWQSSRCSSSSRCCSLETWWTISDKCHGVWLLTSS